MDVEDSWNVTLVIPCDAAELFVDHDDFQLFSQPEYSRQPSQGVRQADMPDDWPRATQV